MIFDSVLWIQRIAASLPGEPKTKLPLGLCHLEEKNTCSAFPLPTCRGSPTSWKPLCTAVPLLKLTHAWRQKFSSQMMIAEEQKAHPGRPKYTRRVQEIFQVQKRSTFSSLCCSPRGQERCARAPLSPACPMQGILGSRLSAASNPSGGVRPCAEPQPDPGSEKVTAKPTSHTPSEPAAQTPCQD